MAGRQAVFMAAKQLQLLQYTVQNMHWRSTVHHFINTDLFWLYANRQLWLHHTLLCVWTLSIDNRCCCVCTQASMKCKNQPITIHKCKSSLVSGGEAHNQTVSTSHSNYSSITNQHSKVIYTDQTGHESEVRPVTDIHTNNDTVQTDGQRGRQTDRQVQVSKHNNTEQLSHIPHRHTLLPITTSTVWGKKNCTV